MHEAINYALALYKLHCSTIKISVESLRAYKLGKFRYSITHNIGPVIIAPLIDL